MPHYRHATRQARPLLAESRHFYPRVVSSLTSPGSCFPTPDSDSGLLCVQNGGHSVGVTITAAARLIGWQSARFPAPPEPLGKMGRHMYKVNEPKFAYTIHRAINSSVIYECFYLVCERRRYAVMEDFLEDQNPRYLHTEHNMYSY